MNQHLSSVALVAPGGLPVATISADPDRQAEVAKLGAEVMPSDIKSTTHLFTQRPAMWARSGHAVGCGQRLLCLCPVECRASLCYRDTASDPTTRLAAPLANVTRLLCAAITSCASLREASTRFWNQHGRFTRRLRNWYKFLTFEPILYHRN